MKHLGLLTLLTLVPLLTACQSTSSDGAGRSAPAAVSTGGETSSVTVMEVPPPKPETPPEKPSKDAFWVVGHWVWENGDWAWKPGFWYQGRPAPRPRTINERIPAAPGPEAVWVEGYWRWIVNGWQWQPGHFLPAAGAGTVPEAGVPKP